MLISPIVVNCNDDDDDDDEEEEEDEDGDNEDDSFTTNYRLKPLVPLFLLHYIALLFLLILTTITIVLYS